MGKMNFKSSDTTPIEKVNSNVLTKKEIQFVEKEVIKEVPVEKIVEVIKEVKVEVPVEKVVEVIKEVPVEKHSIEIKEVPTYLDRLVFKTKYKTPRWAYAALAVSLAELGLIIMLILK